MSRSCLRLALCTLCTALCSSCPRFSIILARQSQWEVRELMESVSPRSTTNSFVVFAFKLSLHFLLAHKHFVFFLLLFFVVQKSLFMFEPVCFELVNSAVFTHCTFSLRGRPQSAIFCARRNPNSVFNRVASETLNVLVPVHQMIPIWSLLLRQLYSI